MYAKCTVHTFDVFVLLLLALNIKGADVNITADSQTGKGPVDIPPKDSVNNLNPDLIKNSSIPDVKPSGPKDDPSGAQVVPSPSGSTTAVPRSVISVIKAHVHQQLPTVPLIGLFATTGQNVTCIVMKAGIRFTFSYRNATAEQMINQSIVDVPVHNYTVDGLCNPDRQSISIVFFPDQDLKWNLTFQFVRNASSQNLAYSEKISLEYSLRTGAKPFPWAKTLSTTAVYNTSGFFSLTLGSSYICLTNTRVSNFTKFHDSHITEMRLYGLQIQAFKTERNNTDFSTIIVQCSSDAVSSTIPLFVGLFMLILIVTVLIVFILRRRMLDRRAAHQKLATEDNDD